MRILITTICFLLVFAGTTRADGLFTPFVGGAESQLTYGFAIGGMGGEVAGFEFDFGYTPDFFADEADVTDQNNLLTVMGNFIAGVPVRAVRPYGSIGVGLIRSRLQALSDVIDISRNDFGMNVGGGVMGFFNESVGIRGDLRYFRSFRDDEESSGLLDLALGSFDFWRATVGVTLRF